MLKVFVNMVLLFAIYVVFIAVVCWICIAIIERKQCTEQCDWKEKLSSYLCRFMDTWRHDWNYEKAGFCVLLLVMILLLIGLCVLAYYAPLEKLHWWNIFEKFIDDHALLTNIFGTLIGIVAVFFILRPRVRIEPYMLPFNISHKQHLKVRVRNIGIFPVNNIEVQLLFYREEIEDGIKVKKTKKIKLFRPDSPILNGVLPKGLDTTYGCATEWTINELRQERKLKRDINNEIKEYEGILCRVKATHAISGVTYVREHKFEKEVVDEFFNKHSNAAGAEISTLKKILTDLDDAKGKIQEVQDKIQNIINTMIL